MASTLAEQLAAKKKAQEEQKNTSETGAASNTLAPTEQTQEEKAQALKATQQVAEDAGTKQQPEAPTGPGAAIQTGIQHSIVQSGATTDAEKQAERTEVDPHLTIVEEPRGSDLSAPNPPNGTLPNSHLVYEGEPGSVMHKHGESLQAGLAQNKLSPEAEEELAKLAEGEARRQRMLSGFPTDDDLRLSQQEAEKPEGGWKATGLTRIVKKNGSVFAAKDGYFVPSDEEEEKELEYFESKGLVEKP